MITKFQHALDQASQGFWVFPIEAGVKFPPRIDDFDNPGLGQRQSYSVEMISNGVRTRIENADAHGITLFPAGRPGRAR